MYYNPLPKWKQEEEEIKKNLKTFETYGNLGILRTEIEKYQKLIKCKTRIREYSIKDRRNVIIERVNQVRN